MIVFANRNSKPLISFKEWRLFNSGDAIALIDLVQKKYSKNMDANEYGLY